MMQSLNIIGILLLSFSLASCNWKVPESDEGLVVNKDTTTKTGLIPVMQDSLTAIAIPPIDNAQNKDIAILPPSKGIDTKKVNPERVLGFAETLIGTPYVYASINPRVGFDCSGFITYVFNHFNISVPRSSVDFTNVGKTIPVEEAKRGDIILFTGTNPLERHVGHMGLIVSNSDTLKFIHSTSGKAMGVTITPLSDYYKRRFVKTIRIFPENGM
ncbi:MAG: C40 family peptidase [Bacteroidota bacterium]|nr:C40 family peptidase [Bacteroidota bacterium]